MTLVGLGSFFFHSTLLFEAQLADELPMIYIASLLTITLLDTDPGFSLGRARTRRILTSVVLFDVLFTWS